MATEVAAVIGNYQGEHLLPDCLASLSAQSRRPIEVIVVDGGSHDASVEVAEAHGARVIQTTNVGLGALYNRGAESVTAPFVVFLNNDVALDPNCLDALAAALEADPSRFAADAQQLTWDSSRTIHAGTRLTRGRLVGEHLPGLHLDSVIPSDGVVQSVCANGAAMLVRRDRHLELGGFDETFFMEWEDLDLCWRAWLRGWPTVYAPRAVVRHRVGASTGKSDAPRRKASSHHNMLRFALKCLPFDAAARLVAGELLRWPRHPSAIGRALVEVTRELPEIKRAREKPALLRATYDSLVSGSEPKRR